MPIVTVIGRSRSSSRGGVGFKRIMRPAVARIGAAQHTIFCPLNPQGPHLRCMCVVNPRLNRFRLQEEGRRFIDGARLRQVIMDTRITFHPRDFRPGRQSLGDFAVSLHQNCVNNI